MEQEKELVEIRQGIEKIDEEAKSVSVTNDQELSTVSDIIRQVKDLAKQIKEKKEKYTEPAKAIVLEARKTYDPLIKMCTDAEAILKKAAQTYIIAQVERKRKEEAAIARRLEKGTIKQETAIRKMEAVKEAPKNVKTESSAIRMTTRTIAKITNPELVPDEYWIINETKVKFAALELHRKGLPGIPGVEIEKVQGVSSF